MKTGYIMGRCCLEEVIKYSPESLVRVWAAVKKGNQRADKLIQRFQEAGVEVAYKNRDELSNMVHSDSHQGFVAEVKRKSHHLKQFLKEERENSLILALDSIEDPQNLGALLRAAECYGADAVLWSKNRGVEITPVVAKASVGATELLPLLTEANLVDSLRKCQEAGYWIVSSEIADDAESLFNFSFPEKTVLVLGSEGSGVRPLVSKQSDFRVYIPMAGRISSLNVSQAASAFLCSWKAQSSNK